MLFLRIKTNFNAVRALEINIGYYNLVSNLRFETDFATTRTLKLVHKYGRSSVDKSAGITYSILLVYHKKLYLVKQVQYFRGISFFEMLLSWYFIISLLFFCVRSHVGRRLMREGSFTNRNVE